MQCPKCEGLMETMSFQQIEFERCAECKGLWFDMLEKEDLKSIEGSEQIDIGDEQVGERWDRVRKTECPKCNVRMLPMIDKDQFDLHYESCPTCYGTFFDAGEFREFKQETVLKRFVHMLEVLKSNL